MNRLLKLLNDNRKNPKRQFEVKALDNGEAEIFIYDAIVDDEFEAEWYGGVAPQSFVAALRAVTASTIHLRINSPGGSVFAARAIETALREHPANIVAHIDGLAASAATFIAMAADQIIMQPGALFMIHKAWSMAMGNADDLKATAELLTKIDGTLAQTYAARSGKTADECMAWMAAETWFTADEALAAGLIDTIMETSQGEDDDDGDEAKNRWNLDAFNNAPGAKPKATIPPPTFAPNANEYANCEFGYMLRKLEIAAFIP